MKKILIINTGGTIGMVKADNGYAPDSAYFAQRLHNMEALKADGMPEWDMMETNRVIDSANVNVSDWNNIGALIAKNYEAYDGFVVLHGTDTMAYTASALSFMLEGLAKPVILTGSQIPLCEIRSDGRDNIISSLLIAASGRVHEVCICFGGRLLRGNRSIKYSADGLIAFASPSCPSLADLGISIEYNDALLLRPSADKTFKLAPFSNIPIGVIKLFPSIQFGLFESILTESLKGIVIETFGTGNIPEDGGALIPIIKKAFERGAIVTICSQCPQGTVALGTYETSMSLKNAGAVSGGDITTEAAVAKLYYLFSASHDKETIKRLMQTPLCGEMKPSGSMRRQDI